MNKKVNNKHWLKLITHIRRTTSPSNPEHDKTAHWRKHTQDIFKGRITEYGTQVIGSNI